MKLSLRIILFISFLFVSFLTSAQTYKIRGLVFDSSRNYPMEAVSVLSTSGRGTITDASGYYEIEVIERDSIWFSYLNKPTVKFPVLKILNPMEFDISLQVSMPVLKEVKIRPKNYKLDSIQNRVDYAKIFNYKKPTLKPTTTNYGAAAGFDLDEIINMFRFRRNKSMAAFQKRLVEREQEVSVDHRFNKALVRRLTHLDGEELDSFMRIYRPSFMFTKLAGDYEFALYIKKAYERFKRGLPPEMIWREDEEQ